MCRSKSTLQSSSQGSLPAMAGAEAAETVQPQNSIWKTAGKDNELHWPVGFHLSQCVLHGRCRSKREFED